MVHSIWDFIIFQQCFNFYSVTKNTIRNTTDGNVIKNWLQNLIASGGDDCPEFAMRGLLDGKYLNFSEL